MVALTEPWSPCRALAVEGYQMKDSLLLPEGKARWVIVSRAITESVGLSYDDCTSGRFCKGPTFPNYDQRMQSVIKASYLPMFACRLFAGYC